MKKLLALICILVFIAGSAVCESQAALETDIEVLETSTPELTPIPTDTPTLIPTDTPTPEPTPKPTEEPTATPEPIEATIEVMDEEQNDVVSEQVEFEEDDWGEINIEFKREVYISFARTPKYFGDTATLVVTLVNFKEDDHYVIAWQYSEDGINWINIQGEDERTYTFIVDKFNCHYSYRAYVTLDEE